MEGVEVDPVIVPSARAVELGERRPVADGEGVRGRAAGKRDPGNALQREDAAGGAREARVAEREVRVVRGDHLVKRAAAAEERGGGPAADGEAVRGRVAQEVRLQNPQEGEPPAVGAVEERGAQGEVPAVGGGYSVGAARAVDRAGPGPVADGEGIVPGTAGQVRLGDRGQSSDRD